MDFWLLILRDDQPCSGSDIQNDLNYSACLAAIQTRLEPTEINGRDWFDALHQQASVDYNVKWSNTYFCKGLWVHSDIRDVLFTGILPLKQVSFFLPWSHSRKLNEWQQRHPNKVPAP